MAFYLLTICMPKIKMVIGLLYMTVQQNVLGIIEFHPMNMLKTHMFTTDRYTSLRLSTRIRRNYIAFLFLVCEAGGEVG